MDYDFIYKAIAGGLIGLFSLGMVFWYCQKDEEKPKIDEKKVEEDNKEAPKEQEKKDKNNKLSLSPPIQVNKFTSSGDYNNVNLQNLERKIDNNNDRYNKEQQVYENIRLIKSSEGDYIHQNMENYIIKIILIIML